MKSIFTVPKLVKYDDLKKTWYVFFRYNGKLIKKTADMNRIRAYKERLIYGDCVAKALHEKLKDGWNPLVPDLTQIEGKEHTFYQALEFALEKKKSQIQDVTLKDYMVTMRVIKPAIQSLNLGQLLITDTKRVHIKAVLEEMKKQRAWSDKSYNKHLGHLQAILSELIQWDIIDFNPAHKIKKLVIEETDANIPPTPSQLKEIAYHLKRKDYGFYVFFSMLFHTGIRPVELTRLKMSMIDLQRMEITLPSNITKTKKKRVVPINEYLWADMNLILDREFPDSFYLFGSERPSGKGNIGLHKDFNPGPTQMKRDTATKRWEKLIKIGLGIKCTMYSIKKAGANAKILAGMSIRALQELFGHTSEVTTEIYITNLQEVMKKEIIAKSPSM